MFDDFYASGMIGKYYDWLHGKTSCNQAGDWVEITTPYLDRHNDYIQLYLKQDDKGYTLTDDSDTLDDLKMCGYSLDNSGIKTTLKGFGVQRDKNELFIKTTKKGFPEAMHSLIQAILAVQHPLYQA